MKKPTKKIVKEKKEVKPRPKIWGVPFAIGNSGREKKFKTPEDLQLAIDNYFEICDSRIIDVYDKPSQSVRQIAKPIPYTVEGLCEVLECDRLTLLNYEKQEGYEAYFNTIKKAKLKIQSNKLERGLAGESNPAVSIFDLKNNHNYVDKTESEVKIAPESHIHITAPDGTEISLKK